MLRGIRPEEVAFSVCRLGETIQDCGGFVVERNHFVEGERDEFF